MTVLCLHYSRTFHRNDPSSIYIASTLVLTMECLKMTINLIFLFVQTTGCCIKEMTILLNREVFGRPADTIQLALPSLLYIIQDNLIIFALSCLDAATYQVSLYSSYILTRSFFLIIVLIEIGNLPIAHSHHGIVCKIDS